MLLEDHTDYPVRDADTVQVASGLQVRLALEMQTGVHALLDCSLRKSQH